MGQMSKITWVGIILVIAGVTSGFLEKIFYGNQLDENNVVQENFFLPLAFILIFIGVAFIGFAVVRTLIRKMRGIA